MAAPLRPRRSELFSFLQGSVQTQRSGSRVGRPSLTIRSRHAARDTPHHTTMSQFCHLKQAYISLIAAGMPAGAPLAACRGYGRGGAAAAGSLARRCACGHRRSWPGAAAAALAHAGGAAGRRRPRSGTAAAYLRQDCTGTLDVRLAHCGCCEFCLCTGVYLISSVANCLLHVPGADLFCRCRWTSLQPRCHRLLRQRPCS